MGLKKKENYHLAWFLLFIWVLRCLLQPSVDVVKAGQSCVHLKDLNGEAVFSPKYGSAAGFSPPTKLYNLQLYNFIFLH